MRDLFRQQIFMCRELNFNLNPNLLADYLTQFLLWTSYRDREREDNDKVELQFKMQL